MTKAGAIKLSILFFLIFILCLPEFFPQVLQIQYLCETVDPCTSENVLVDVRVCGQADFPCTTEIRNSSSQDGPTGWYLCKTETDSHIFHDNNSILGEHAMVVLTLKGDNLSQLNISVFVLLNHTDLYTGHQNPQRLFYCLLLPNKSNCPDMNMSTEPTKESFSPPRPVASTSKTIISAKPLTSSLLKTMPSLKEMSSTQKLNCQPASSDDLIHYLENNQTSATFSESWWCVTTAVWFFLVLILLIVALTSVGCLIFKSRRTYRRKSHLVAVLARNYQLKEISEQRGNLMRNAPDVSVAVWSVGDDDDDDDDVFFKTSSTENRPDENLLKVNASYKRSLSPVFEITEDCNEDEKVENHNSLVTKQVDVRQSDDEFKEILGHCQTLATLHHRSNPSCSCHETDGEP